MHHRERLFIYAALVILGAAQLANLIDATGSHAVASPIAKGTDDLGPAGRLILADADAAELAIFNRAGRPAWGEAPTHGAYNFALVNVDPIINGIMRSGGYTEDREILTEEFRTRDGEFITEREALEGQLRDLTPDDPQIQRIMEDAQALYQEHMEFRRDSTVERGRMESDQLQRAFQEMITGIDIVADRLGIDVVYQFAPLDEEFEGQNRVQVNQEIRVRSFLRYPEGLDITADVMDELSLEID